MQNDVLRRSCFAILLACGCSSTEGSAPADPNAPSNLKAVPQGGGAHLTWNDNSSDEEVFEIERNDDAAVSSQTIASLPFDTEVYHDADVVLGQRYTYRLRAKLQSGFTSYSNVATVTVTLTDEGTGGSTGAGGTSVTVGGSGSGVGGTGSGAAGGQQGEAGNTATGGTVDPGAPVSFSADVVPSLVASCGSTTSGCHSRDQAVGRSMPQFGPCMVIWFSSVDEPVGSVYTSGPNEGQPTGCPDLGLYDRLLQLHSMLCDAPSWDQRAKYVVPYDLDNSLLYQVLVGDPSMAGACTIEGVPVGPMPKVDPEVLPDPVELSVEQADKIRDWILQGAPNN
jgi:hypothetical protein